MQTATLEELGHQIVSGEAAAFATTKIAAVGNSLSAIVSAPVRKRLHLERGDAVEWHEVEIEGETFFLVRKQVDQGEARVLQGADNTPIINFNLPSIAQDDFLAGLSQLSADYTLADFGGPVGEEVVI
ncbi:AbrB/MazE/SpoVT family DNA-binding domain-containing protein [Chitinibacter tainanensis]|uniref:AbrB/MazE/SpoVT family DNA-binding domain-containing protein n=1 Tax=Chitinibacter tainanensis TaxID=230667 RepID=UPI00040FAD36|nr:hypothetical protein [Chitinibacter tainanensis]